MKNMHIDDIMEALKGNGHEVLTKSNSFFEDGFNRVCIDGKWLKYEEAEELLRQDSHKPPKPRA